MVTDFSTGLFQKTPSEEGGWFPFPPSTPNIPTTPDPNIPITTATQGIASFSPSSLITSVG